MDNEIKTWLFDIKTAISEINSFFEDARNRIIHGYDTISDDVIWSIVIRHLPKLNEEIEQLIAK
jgi:uncharacterized protein with HEPN domain